jgi:hypothetical protein
VVSLLPCPPPRPRLPLPPLLAGGPDCTTWKHPLFTMISKWSWLGACLAALELLRILAIFLELCVSPVRFVIHEPRAECTRSSVNILVGMLVSVSVNYKNGFIYGHVGRGMVEEPYECDESQNSVLGLVVILYQE